MQVYRIDDKEDFFPEIVPLVDIVLLVLIFFLVTATFVATPQKLDIVLPETELADGPAETTFRLFLSETGRVRFRQQWIDKTELPGVFRGLQNEVDNPVLLITADARSRHQSLVDIIGAARQVGIEQYGFEIALTRGKLDG